MSAPHVAGAAPPLVTVVPVNAWRCSDLPRMTDVTHRVARGVRKRCSLNDDDPRECSMPTMTYRDGIPYRRLGRTGEMVSLIGVGGYHLGRQADEQETIRIVRTAVDNGINFLDNCWDYNGEAREIPQGDGLRPPQPPQAYFNTHH